ncbi:MAG TPA: PAS domain-containing protein [bacterium (Candidatus Stahlbacteria)]|nr:PAS domain-containing protein [Candidatus Stahlbacteria bacterium]
MFGPVISGIVEVTKKGEIESFSKEMVMMTGYTEKETVTEDWHQFFSITHDNGSCPIKEALEELRPVTNQSIHLQTKSGLKKPFLVNVLPAENRVILVIFGLDSINRLQHLLQKEQGEFWTILNAIGDGVFTVNTNWIITNFNPAATQITGYHPDEAIGKPCHEIFRSRSCRTNCPLRRAIETGERVVNYEMEIETRDGRTIPISLSTGLLINEEGEIVGGVETFRDLSTLRRLGEALKEKYSFGNIIGKDPKMQRIYDLITTISTTDVTVLIQGDTGTGKDLVARAIHYNSPRKEKPFIKVSCAALPETLLESELFGYRKGAFTGAVKDKPGRFELADKGTIFLDEVGDLPLSVQVKLLRVLEEQSFEPLGGTKTEKVDVRIIAATNQDLRVLVREGKFRDDLYYRLHVVSINLPPLRERSGDIPLLIHHFIARFNRRMQKNITRVSQEVMNILIDYPWPGNIRQLEHTIEHAFVHCSGKTILPEHLPDEILTKQKPILSDPVKPLAEVEKDLILETLKRFRGNRKKTAQALGISRVTLWRWMKKYNL